jgi:hypothetical protein
MTNGIPSKCSQWSWAVIQIKVKCVPVHIMKKYCGYRVLTPCILQLGTRWTWVVSFMSYPFNSWIKSTHYPLNWRLGEVQSWSECCSRRKNLTPLPGIKLQLQGEIFFTCPDWPWGPPSLLYNGFQVSFPGVKRLGRGIDHDPHLAPRLKKD